MLLQSPESTVRLKIYTLHGSIASSSVSQLLDGSYCQGNGVTDHSLVWRDVKVKLLPRTHQSLAEKEYRNLCTLHEESQGHFVKPFALLTDCRDFASDNSDVRFTDHVAVVLELGSCSLSEYLKMPDLSHPKKVEIAFRLLEIMAGASSQLTWSSFLPSTVMGLSPFGRELIWTARCL